MVYVAINKQGINVINQNTKVSQYNILFYTAVKAQSLRP